MNNHPPRPPKPRAQPVATPAPAATPATVNINFEEVGAGVAREVRRGMGEVEGKLAAIANDVKVCIPVRFYYEEEMNQGKVHAI